MKRLLTTIAGFAIVLGLAQAQSQSDGAMQASADQAAVRVAHFVLGGPDVSVRIDGNIVLDGVSPETVSGYLLLPAGEHTIELVVPRDASSAPSAATGGAETGGATTGGADAMAAETGGATTGGAETGGAETGGLALGGAETGGAETGGAETGGAIALGDSATGGAETGGADTGGATTTDADTGGATMTDADTGGATTGGADTAAMEVPQEVRQALLDFHRSVVDETGADEALQGALDAVAAAFADADAATQRTLDALQQTLQEAQDALGNDEGDAVRSAAERALELIGQPLPDGATGGADTGGALTGGVVTDSAATGGADTGGADMTDATTGGAETGGAEMTGATTGGADTGGATTGGSTTMEAATGGAATGGAATGGATTGGEATDTSTVIASQTVTLEAGAYYSVVATAAQGPTFRVGGVEAATGGATTGGAAEAGADVGLQVIRDDLRLAPAGNALVRVIQASPDAPLLNFVVARSSQADMAGTTGGAETGGAETGGAETGGAETGGAATTEAATGGAETGGAQINLGDTGGAATGGAATGGASQQPGELTISLTPPQAANAIVSVTGPDGYEQRAADGQTLSGLTPGTYVVTATQQSYQPAATQVQVPGGGTVQAELTLQRLPSAGPPPIAGESVISDLEYASASDYVVIPAGSYNAQLQATDEDMVALELRGATFQAGAAYTLFVYGGLADDSITVTVTVDALAPQQAAEAQTAGAAGGTTGGAETGGAETGGAETGGAATGGAQ